MIRAVVLAFVVSGLALAEPAQANFAVCNKTTHPMLVAIAYSVNGAWLSEGWWRVEPQKCSDILTGALKARYYYVRGVHLGADGGWDGNRFFCVATDNFTIKGRDKCRKRGYTQSGFFEVDTGEKSSWTQNLSD